MSVTQGHALVTPELIKRRQERSFKPFYPKDIYFNTQANRDTIRHFADGLGDTNPLFRDREYARNTKYGCIIAPPSFLYSVRWLSPGRGFTGVHGWYSGGEWEWYRPIYEGDEFKVVCVLLNQDEKAGKMGKGRTWIDYSLVLYVNQNDEVVGGEKGYSVFAERSKAGSAGKFKGIPKPSYTEEELQSINEMYEKEEIRGPEPRYWEDVEIGEQIGPMVKGPLTVRDIITWMMGGGSQFYKAHKIAHEWFKRHPGGLMIVKALGERDIPELVHIFDAYAREIGVERAYDYGCQRMSWLCNLLTNWIGDEGFLWKMRGDMRSFNMVGDTTCYEGKVVRKYLDNGRRCVAIEAWAKNQRGEMSMAPQESTVLLPSREHGPITYPDPPAERISWVKAARPLDEILGKS
jgi:acyl dehydratase